MGAREERVERRFLHEAARGSRVWRFRRRQAAAFTALFGGVFAYEAWLAATAATVTLTLNYAVFAMAALLAATVTAATWLHSAVMEGGALHVERGQVPP